ncbi:Gfo/Idh/MocA family protein [Flavihumibacter solisilvae]|uniref:Gfo/Idh/MocA family protein n=1 Tax=Flavihumibacter solisilvae TaxID=1349421 RepID=UPI000AEECA6C|nr:Gfo/Idh/MocA family oxidoreductase [Flavihumibacter solisilvae]
MKNISRKNFLTNFGVLGAAAVLSPSVLATAAEKGTADVPQLPLNRKVRVGLIGCGSVSGVYLPHLANCQFAEVVSLCDIKPDRAQKRAKQFSGATVYPHIDKMLAGVPFDLLINTTNMQEHGRLNKIAIAAGKHVWCEKPLANTYKEGREILDLAKAKGVKIWGAPAVVNSPQFAFMAKQIAEGKLGRIAAAHGHYGHEGPHWSAFFYEENGGSLPDLGVYNIATLTGLFGPAKSVVAMTNVITPTRNVEDKGSIQVVAEDNAQVLFEHHSGVISHIQCGFNYFDPYGHQGKGQERPTISVYGSKGNMHMVGYDWMPFGVDMATHENPATQRFATDTGSYVWQEGASVICECMSTGKQPLINVEHSLHVLEIIEAARESQRTGQRINLNSAFPWPMVG